MFIVEFIEIDKPKMVPCASFEFQNGSLIAETKRGTKVFIPDGKIIVDTYKVG